MKQRNSCELKNRSLPNFKKNRKLDKASTGNRKKQKLKATVNINFKIPKFQK